MRNSQNIAEALRWITGAFSNAGVPHQLVGGLAAQAHGAKRHLHDIDFYVPGKQLSFVAPHVEEKITFGPERYQDEQWNLAYMKMRYNGLLVEVADAESTFFFDQKAQEWVNAEVDFTASVWKEIYGVEVPVMPKKKLIEYKRRLDREVDRQDVREMLEADERAAA